MIRREEKQEINIDAPSAGGSVVVLSVLAGVVLGTAANILALYLGHTVWIALLCHGVVGALAMFVALALLLARPGNSKRTSAPKVVTGSVSAVRH